MNWRRQRRPTKGEADAKLDVILRNATVEFVLEQWPAPISCSSRRHLTRYPCQIPLFARAVVIVSVPVP